VRSYTWTIGQYNHGWRWASIVGLAAVLLAGCFGSDDGTERDAGNVVQPGAPGEPTRKLSGEEVAELETPEHTKADVRFMQDMIHHHRQAVVMTRWVPRRTASEDIRLMSRRIELSQQTEIEAIQRWLRTRGIEPRKPVEHSGHHGSGHHHGSGEELMPGMLTSKQLGRLRKADGHRFDRTFLRYMTFHHQGALTMVQRLDEAGGGLEPELGAFARHVVADQEIEIGRMRDLYARMRQPG
jgi:uncharacterized protein (DUF305 family)